MAKKIITLYIDDSSLRLTETHGQRIKKWAYLPLDQGTVTNNVVTNESALAAKIRQLFRALKIRGKKTAVGLSGLHCLSRPITLPQLPRDMLDEAVKREARRTLPVPPEQLYISWQIIPSPEKQSAVFLVALPRSTVDTLVGALRQAGLEASFIGIKPLLLSRMIKETTAIIIDVQLTEFDVIIITNGIPQTIRTVRFSDEALSTENKIEMIRSEIDRTINFYNSSNPKDPLAPDVPIFTSGKLTDDLRLYQALSDDAEHPVQPLLPLIESPDGFDPDTYLVNVGLTLQQLNGRAKPGSSLVTLNSLPLNYQTKQVSFTNVIAIPGAVVAIGLLAFFIVMNQSAAASIGSTSVKMNSTQQILQQTLAYKEDLSGDIEKLKSQLAQIETSYTNLEAAQNSIQKQGSRIKGDMLKTIEGLPNTVALSSINYSSSTMTIIGIAPRKYDILQYLKNLKDSNLFGEIVISKMTKTKEENMEFTLLVNLERTDNNITAIQVVLGSIPTNVSLTGIRQANGTITINGRSTDEDSIVLFLKTLEDSNVFREAAITGKTNAKDGGLDFTLVVRTRG
ncbi:MAG: PilN domain-containing protein [Chloroflexi bacterium]|nr:PilN domain-containing protein [Chloroflexota bacterium]